jgi:hypothetical protein
MAIAATTAGTSGSSTNGATTNFTFAFSIADYGAVEAEDQIEVILQTTATGAETILTRGTSAGQYSVAINADQSASPGGSITTITTYASGYKIWIRLAPSFLQTADYQNQGAFNAATINAELDQLTRKILELKDKVRRAPHVSLPAGSSFDGKITGPFTVGYAITVNGAGTGWTLSSSIAAGAISATMASFCNAASFAAALSGIGLGTEDTPAFAGVIGSGSTAGTAPGQFVNTADAASVAALRIEGDRATPANNDNVYASFYMSNNAAAQVEYARISALASSVSGHAAHLRFHVATGGVLTNYLTLLAGALVPSTHDTLTLGNATNAFSDADFADGAVLRFNNVFTVTHSTGVLTANGALKSSSPTGGMGYGSGAGGAVTQGTNRTTAVELNKVCGAITLISAAGSATPASFTVTNSTVEATDTIMVNQKSGTDKYVILVTAVANGSFQITSYTTGGTTTEQPVFSFAVHKAVAA